MISLDFILPFLNQMDYTVVKYEPYTNTVFRVPRCPTVYIFRNRKLLVKFKVFGLAIFSKKDLATMFTRNLYLITTHLAQNKIEEFKELPIDYAESSGFQKWTHFHGWVASYTYNF